MTSLQHHTIATALIDAELCTAASFAPISDRVRDRTDVHALRCQNSGVIILNRVDHINSEIYEDLGDLSYWGDEEKTKLLASTAPDDKRRAEFIRPHIQGKRYLDVGTGLGGILNLVRTDCSEVHAIEPQAGARAALTGEGYVVMKSIDDATPRSYDVVTLFHVYEHIPDQIPFLRKAKTLLKPGGMLVVEVPHAKDALLTLYENQAFLNFTLWSQHLILHTQESLRNFMEQADFRDIRIQGVQRYPLPNHLYWLAKNKPGGHVMWDFLNSEELVASYEKALVDQGITDTLLATASA